MAISSKGLLTEISVELDAQSMVMNRWTHLWKQAYELVLHSKVKASKFIEIL